MDAARIDRERLLMTLERRAEPEERDRGRARRARVRFVEEANGPDELVIRGTIRNESQSAHQASLTVRRDRLETQCDCRSPHRPCRHLLALAGAWAAKSPAPRSDRRALGWREVMEGLVPHRHAAASQLGREVLVHWVGLEEGLGGVWSLGLSWRIHKIGIRGIGRGLAVRQGQLLKGLHWVLTEEDYRVLQILETSGLMSPDSAGSGPVRVSGSRVDPILRSLARAPWVYSTKTRSLLRIDQRPPRVKILAVLRGNQLSVRAEWEGGPLDAEDGPARVVGSSPPWVERSGVLSPVIGVENGQALARLAEAGVEVPKAEFPVFLGSVLPDLEAQGIGVALTGLEGKSFLVREIPVPRLYLSEEAGALVGALRFSYGDYEIPAERPELVLTVGSGSFQAFVHREMEAEFQATQRLRRAGFQMVEPGRFEIAGDDALEFLRCELGPLAAQWEIFGENDLKRYRVAQSPVSIRLRLGAGADWLELGIEAQAPGDTIPPEEVLWALRKRSRYVRLGSGAHAVLPSEWIERVGPVLDEIGAEAPDIRLPRYMVPLLEELAEKAPELIWRSEPAWQNLVSALRSGTLPPRPVPAGFAGTFRPYQEEGYRWLGLMGDLRFGCILADDMGLGKTVQALAVLSAEAERGEQRPSLVVAPTSVVPNWEEEAKRFTPGLKVLRYHGSDRQARARRFEGQDLVVTSYAVLRRDIRVLGSVEWNYAILDEAQAIKNAATQTARAVRRLKTSRRLALTGTPLENHLGEIWSQFHFLAPGLLGTERHFARAFGRPISQGDRDALDRLRRRIAPFVLRRLKTQVAKDLPEKVESVLRCEMDPAQELLYRSVLVASRERVFREVARRGLVQARFSILEALLRLRQICCHPEILPKGLGHGIPSAKFELFRHFVSEVVDEGHRILVFSQFVSVLGILRKWFEESGIPHLYLDGRTRDREEKVRRFQEDESVRVFLVSLKAGGFGLNLTGADYVILYDPWWNPAVETQAADRAHRIGQTRRVFSYKMITRGTVEEKILALQERKRDLTDELIRAGQAWGSALTEEDLEELFRL